MGNRPAHGVRTHGPPLVPGPGEKVLSRRPKSPWPLWAARANHEVSVRHRQGLNLSQDPDLTDWSHQTALLDNNNNVRDHEKTLHEAQNSGIVEQKTKKTNP